MKARRFWLCFGLVCVLCLGYPIRTLRCYCLPVMFAPSLGTLRRRIDGTLALFSRGNRYAIGWEMALSICGGKQIYLSEFDFSASDWSFLAVIFCSAMTLRRNREGNRLKGKVSEGILRREQYRAAP